MSRLRNLGLFCALAVVWGTAFAATKLGLASIPPILFAAVRFDLAAVLLFAYVFARGVDWRPKTRGDVRHVLVGGALFVRGFRQFDRAGSEPAAVRAFFTSNLFLAVLFTSWGLGGVVSDAGPWIRVLVAIALPVLFVRLWTARPALRDVRASGGDEWRVGPHRLRDGIEAVLRKYIRENDHVDVFRGGNG